MIAALNRNPFKATTFALFNYQALAFLQGHIHLTTLPPSTHDLSLYQGHYYLYWLPFPAFVLLPFIAMLGVGFPDVLFNAVLGGTNVALVALLLDRAAEQRLITVDRERRTLLVVAFALGSVHLPLAVLGRVWFTAQLVGFTCVALAYLGAVTLRGPRAWLAVGLAMGGATLTRSHLLFAGLWPAWLLLMRWIDEGRSDGWRTRTAALARSALLIGLPVITAVALVLWFNVVRFGDPFESGITYQRMDTLFRAEFERWGAFSPHYLATNLYYQYIHYPVPLSSKSLMGGSLFLMTPVFAAAFWAFHRSGTRWSQPVLAASIVLVAIPIVLLMGTGWRQWGPRYTLDFTVPLLVLTAGGLDRWPIWVVRAATLVAGAHYVIGTVYVAPLLF